MRSSQSGSQLRGMEKWKEKCSRLHFLCPKCNRECDYVIGELVFPEYKESWTYAFRVCWKCEIVRTCKPFGWTPKGERSGGGRNQSPIKGKKEYPIKWWTISKARQAMFQARGDMEVSLDLSDKGIQGLRARQSLRFRAAGAGAVNRGVRRG